MTADNIDQICELFARDSESQLDATTISDLRVAVRISADFCDFVDKFGSTAPHSEVEYMMNTIRSGIDEFVAIAILHRVLEQSITSSRIGWIEFGDLEAMRSVYQTRFRALMNPEIGFGERLESLLSLCQSQLAFLADGFKLIV